MMKKIALLVFALLLSGCNNGIEKTYTIHGAVSQCENTFVLSSSEGGDMMVFEHAEDGVGSQKIFDGTWIGNDVGVYNCEHNALVALYTYRWSYFFGFYSGVRVIGLDGKSDTLHPVDEDLGNWLIAPYDQGIIYSDPGGYFSLDSNTVEVAYSSTMQAKNGKIQGDYLYTYTQYGYYDYETEPKKINLTTQESSLVWKTNGKNVPRDIATNHIDQLFVGSRYCLIGPSSVEESKNNALYCTTGTQMEFLSEIPGDAIIYTLSPDDDTVLLFTRKREVYRYSLSQKSIITHSTLDISLATAYHLNTVGYTAQNFILAFERDDNDTDSRVIVSDKTFEHFGEPISIGFGNIAISTQLAINRKNTSAVSDESNTSASRKNP